MGEATVMERLRAETADLHASAEGMRFQQNMVKGKLARADYCAWLGQMLHIHRALEAPLRARMTDANFVALRDEQMQEPYLLDDLEWMGIEPGSQPTLSATAAMIDEIERVAQESPLSLLGYHYVLEGSNNGNRFIARRLGPALGLDGKGCRYLDPYGEAQREKWALFKSDMDGVGFSSAEKDTLVAAARRMFEAIGAISGELAALRSSI